MSMINCPECGNECSSSAAACPKCGYSFVVPVAVAEPEVIVREVPRREKPFPPWAFVPLILLGVGAIFLLIYMLRNDDDPAQRNINVNIAAARTPLRTASNTTLADQPNEIVVPSTSQPMRETVIPPTGTTSDPGNMQTTTIPGSTVPVAPTDKGLLSVEAKLSTRSGATQPVTKEKFYLLDRDLQSILLEAGIEDEEGQGLVNSFGMSVVNPGKYGETNRRALAAINKHVVYSTITDAGGKAQIKDIKPDTYYLFGITKTRSGFAVWDAPITVQPGQNSLMLPAKTITEIAPEQ